MMKVVLIATALVFFALPQGHAGDVTLSWQQIVEKTRQSNEEMKASENRLASSAHKVSASYGNYYPQLSAVVARNQSGSSASTPSSSEEYSLGLTATENLFAGFKDQATVLLAQNNLEVAEANLQAIKAKVSYDLKAAIAALIYSQSYIKLSQSIIQRRELNLRLVQLRFDGGRENKGSLLLSKAYLEEARLDHLEAEQNLIVAQGQVKKVLGDDSAVVDSFAGEVPVTGVPSQPTEEEFQHLVQQTPTYKYAVADQKNSRATLTQSKAGYYPSLNLTGSVGQVGPTWYPDRDNWSLGLNLTLPLLNGGRDYYTIQGATETLKASTLNINTILKDQLVQLKTAYANYIKIIQRVKVDQAHVIAAEVREKISRQKYNNGLSTFEDWDGIETELIKRQKDFLSSQRDRIVTEAAWEQALGKGVFQ